MTDFEPQRGKFAGHGIEVTFIRRFMGDRREDMIESVKVNERPLVVIDPEDREAVERLRDLWDAAHEQQEGHLPSLHKKGARGNCLHAALREFVNSTPPEPTNSKACVTDRRGGAWRLLADGDWICVDGPDVGEYLNWQGLTKRGPLTIETPDA